MRGFTSDVSPPVRPRGSSGLVSVVSIAALAAALLGLTGLIASPSPASASPHPAASTSSRLAATAATSTAQATSAPSTQAPAGTATPSGSPTPSPTPTPGPPTLDRLPSRLVTSFPLVVSGSGTPGDTIDVSGGSSPNASESCTAPVGSDQRWSCDLQSLPDGPGVPVRAESSTTSASAVARVDVLGPPVIAGGGATASGGAVSGTAYPNARVTVTADTGASCTFPAGSSGNWGCVLAGTLPDGRHTVTATQVAGFSSQRSASSPPTIIDVDRTSPAAPTITSPAGGTSARVGTAVAFSGAGETGDHLTLYATSAQGSVVVCAADVAGGAWTCPGALAEGRYSVSALQRDPAGNVSPGSNVVAFTVSPAAGVSAPAPTHTPGPTATAPATPAPAAPSAGPPADPPRDGRGWIETPFTTASAPVVSVATLPGWMRALGLAVAALLLLVLPARLLTGAIARGRASRADGSGHRRASVFGRNRPRSEVSEASALFGGPSRAAASASAAAASAASASAAAGSASTGEPSRSAPEPADRRPLRLGLGVVAGAAVLVTLSTPVSDPAAYLRMLLAVAIAVAAVNAVWVLAGRGLAPHLGLAVPRVTVRPGMLTVVAVAALGSRLLGLSPALLFALVLGIALAPHAGRVRRGRIAAVQVSAVAALGVIAWLAVGLLPTPTGAFTAFLVELANGLAMVGIGSASVLLLPLGGLPGRAIAQWSRWLWAGLSVVVYTVLFALLLPVASMIEDGIGILVVVGVAAGFAAASLAVWLWRRYVAPALDRPLP